MCHRVTCSDCGKPDWSGCGAHIEYPNVLGSVPKEDRCQCREDGTRKNRPSALGSLLGGLFGGGR